MLGKIRKGERQGQEKEGGNISQVSREGREKELQKKCEASLTVKGKTVPVSLSFYHHHLLLLLHRHQSEKDSPLFSFLVFVSESFHSFNG